MWKPDFCIYHFPCDDGFAAAWVVRKKWPVDVALRPTNYGQPIPVTPAEVAGKDVLITDFSFKPAVLEELAAAAGSIVILDHHKTAEEDLAGLNRLHGNAADTADELIEAPGMVFAEFDMQRSGAMLTWRFCFPDVPPPPLINFIEDRDLWRMTLPETRAVSLFLRSYPYEFPLWDEIAARTLDDLEGVLAEARGIERFYDRKLAELIPVAVRRQVIGGFAVPVLNVPWAFASDAAHELLQADQEAPFAAAYFDNGDGRTYSLRSEDRREDVSAIARRYGGGGHRNAAGFRMPL